MPKVEKILQRVLFLSTVVVIICSCNFSQKTDLKQTLINPIKRVEMNLSAFGVEADDFPSINALIDFVNDSNSCTKSYYNPAFKSSVYKLTSDEVKEVLHLLQSTDLEKLKKEYAVSETDQPSSTTVIYTKEKKFIIKDYGLEGESPLRKLYKIVYKL